MVLIKMAKDRKKKPVKKLPKLPTFKRRVVLSDAFKNELRAH